MDGLATLAEDIKRWGGEVGLSAVGISGTAMPEEEAWLAAWLAKGFHGSMDYMARHGTARARPQELVPGTVRVIAARLDYSPPDVRDAWQTLEDPGAAFVSRYALGRDYHKVLRAKLQRLAARIESALPALLDACDLPPFAARVFTDSAPVMEVALARRAGLGWRGKHTLLLSREAGSLFFLGEIYTNLPLPVDAPVSDHCGSCARCIEACPTGAIVAPYQLDARRCISYLTIESKEAIPLEFRRAMGNRIYGCDDCQLVCPWNKFARQSREADFAVRNGLDRARLVELFALSAEEFGKRFEGSAIRRIGHERWQRNLAVALGNALAEPALASDERARIVAALVERRPGASELVAAHIDWALAQVP
jgi:epoxyqueuosine reductase